MKAMMNSNNVEDKDETNENNKEIDELMDLGCDEGMNIGYN